MTEQEGVIKFHLQHALVSPEAMTAPEVSAWASLLGWRSVIFDLGLIGQAPTRYGGLGYGNVSIRLVDVQGPRFLVSASQTSGLARPSLEHFCEVFAWDLSRHEVKSRGLLKPSSESTTHAMIYDWMPDVGCVLHVHSPEIWQKAQALGLVCTPDDVEYGTAQMALAVRKAFSARNHGWGVFAMLGHEDGVVAFGRDADQAGQILIRALAEARAKDMR